MLDRMYKQYPKGEAPPAFAKPAGQIRGADCLVERHRVRRAQWRRLATDSQLLVFGK